MTSILLDTNALLWLTSTPERISASARTVLEYQGNELFVSAASTWEVAIKTRIGRLNGAPLLSAWDDVLADMNATEVAISGADATIAGQLDWEHKDPFDRMIVAQAARRGLTIATSDSQLIQGALTPVLVTVVPVDLPSPAIQHAVQLLRYPTLEDDYDQAWTEWSSGGDAEAWHTTTTDRRRR